MATATSSNGANETLNGEGKKEKGQVAGVQPVLPVINLEKGTGATVLPNVCVTVSKDGNISILVYTNYAETQKQPED